MKNKKWVKPELIILVRGDSGESVLVACKTGNNMVSSTNPQGDNYDCVAIFSKCTDCSTISAT